MRTDELLVLYGTQTDTAKGCAEDIGREAMRRGLSADIMAFDDYSIEQLPLEERLAIFVVATTGEGEPPVTMVNSWNFLLRDDLPPDSLADLNFTVFGLGDSSYELFNVMATKLNKRLRDLGA